MSKTNNWLTASINPPPMDKDIIARDKVSVFGYPHSYKTYHFDSDVVSEGLILLTFMSNAMVEWKFIEDKDAEEFGNE